MYLMSLFNNLVLNKTINLYKKRNFFNGLDIFRERRMISWLLDDMPYNPFLSLCFQICYCLFLNTHEQAQKQLISVISPCQKWLSFPQAVVLDGCADVWGWKRWQSQPGPVGGGDSCYCPQLETEVSPAAESSAESAEASQNSQHMNIPTEKISWFRFSFFMLKTSKGVRRCLCANNWHAGNPVNSFN